MFNKKQENPSPKPDPPISQFQCNLIAIFVLALGFSLTVSALRDINSNLRHEETKPGYKLPEVPIAPDYR